MMFFIETFQISHLCASGAVNGFCPGDTKLVECIKIRVDVAYLPDIIPDSLRTVRIAAAAGLDCHVCHAAQHCIGAEPGSVFFQCGTVFIQRLAFNKWFCSVFLPIGPVPGRIDRKIAVSGLIQHKIKPRFVIIVICKRAFIRVMCGLQCSIAVHFFHILCDLTPAFDGTLPRFSRKVACHFACQRPHNRKGAITGNDVACQMFLVLYALFDRSGPGKAECIDKAEIGEILHAAVKFLLIKCHIWHIIRGICFPVTTLLFLPAVASKVRLINVIALFLPAIRHATEHACHLRMVRLIPPLTKSKFPVRIAEPEKRCSVCIRQIFS